MKKLTTEEKLEHVTRCEFHRGTKPGVCPVVSKKEIQQIKRERKK